VNLLPARRALVPFYLCHGPATWYPLHHHHMQTSKRLPGTDRERADSTMQAGNVLLRRCVPRFRERSPADPYCAAP
jgi:hypothetical protein